MVSIVIEANKWICVKQKYSNKLNMYQLESDLSIIKLDISDKFAHEYIVYIQEMRIILIIRYRHGKAYRHIAPSAESTQFYSWS